MISVCHPMNLVPVDRVYVAVVVIEATKSLVAFVVVSHADPSDDRAHEIFPVYCTMWCGLGVSVANTRDYETNLVCCRHHHHDHDNPVHDWTISSIDWNVETAADYRRDQLDRDVAPTQL